MKVRNIEVHEVKVTNFDSRTGNMKLQISFLDDTPIFTNFNVSESHESMAEKIIETVKKQKRPVDDEENDVLSGISIINVSNDDDIREKLGKGVMRLEQRFDNLKRTRQATEYIRAYSQMSTTEDIIYKKGC
jgi:hypothetical protein